MPKDNLSLEYIAGFFDGEGCIKIGYGKYTYLRYKLQIGIGQKSKNILMKIQQKYGGSIYTKYDKRTDVVYYEWDANSQRACQILEQIYPYLQEKKPQAKLAIEFQKFTHSHVNKSRLSELEKIEKYSYYEAAKEEMHFLKK